MAKDQINEAAWNLTKSYQEANQAIADNAIAAQERNMRFAQSVFENGVEVLKSHAEETRSLMQELTEQPQKRQGTFQTVMDSTIAAQQRNVKFAQSVYENGTELLKSHIGSARGLMETLVEQSHAQQEAYQTLARDSINAYTDFLSAPFSYYQQALETAGSIARQGVETAQKITRHEQEVVQASARQGQKAAQAAAK